MDMTRSVFAAYVTRHRAVLLVVAIGLISRLSLLSVSLDEGDSANFYNALEYGYNVSLNRPHAPGYPLYVFLGWLVNAALDDPLLSLTLLSALLGSLAVVPFYLLLRDFTDTKMAVVGSLLFMANPLVWSFSEVALSDAPSMFFVVLASWLAYAARRSNKAFFSACVVMSLAIGVRQSNMSLLVLLAFPISYRVLAAKERPWRLAAIGAALFTVTSMAWFVPAVFIGSGGFAEYFESVSRQWSIVVRASDVTHLQSPWVPNLLYRVERFFLGYFVTYAWTGSDDKVPATLFLIAPWLFGFALFIVGFRPRSPVHIFVALWLASLAYPILAIHFLPRYGLPHLPGFIIACILGYRFLAFQILRHPRSFEVLSLAGIGTVLLMYGVKHQPPVGTFESTPPETEPYVAILLLLGLMVLVLVRWLARRREPEAGDRPAGSDTPSNAKALAAHVGAVVTVLALLVVPYSIKGYSLASLAHRSPSPSQRLVEFVSANFDTRDVISCWDLQTQFIFGALTPGGGPVGRSSIEGLYAAHKSGRSILLSDGCRWFSEIDEAFDLLEITHFDGASPVWSKNPSIQLYMTSGP